MSCRIVIPSHLRHDRVLSKDLLIDPIIVVEKSQEAIYKDYNPDVEIVTHPDDVKGLIPKRNWMYRKFGDMFMVDDDVYIFRKLYIKEGDSQRIKAKSEITQKIYQLHELAKLTGINLFGFTKNPQPVQFNQFRPFSLQNMVTGCAYGVIKSKNIWWNEDLQLKEDFWISGYIKHKERAILIDNRYNFTQKDTFVNAGGLAHIRNNDTELTNMMRIKKFFGDAVRLRKENHAAKKRKKHNITMTFPF